MKRKRGRKKKPVAERKVAAMALRMLWELKHKLQAAAALSGRSVSEEACWRLTMSFLFNHEIQEIARTQAEIEEKFLR
jgi:hypothetical protein